MINQLMQSNIESKEQLSDNLKRHQEIVQIYETLRCKRKLKIYILDGDGAKRAERNFDRGAVAGNNFVILITLYRPRRRVTRCS